MRAHTLCPNHPRASPPVAATAYLRFARSQAGRTADDLLGDSRFGSLFDNPDFAIDEGAEDFKLRNPSGVGATARQSRRDEEDMDSDRDDNDDEEDKSGAAAIKGWGDDDEGYSDGGGGSGGGCSESENEDGFRGAKVRGER